jgi:nicotinamide-nucleotide amidase
VTLPEGDPATAALAQRALAALGARGLTVACAESLTGGLVAATITAVPGASAAFRGAVVAYATELKGELLGVDPVLLAAEGPVSARVARQMAEGVRRACRATYGVATTGVAGPDPQGGHPVGTVHLAVAGPRAAVVTSPVYSGTRAQIRAATVAGALRLLVEAAEEWDT